MRSDGGHAARRGVGEFAGGAFAWRALTDHLQEVGAELGLGERRSKARTVAVCAAAEQTGPEVARGESNHGKSSSQGQEDHPYDGQRLVATQRGQSRGC
jgi:hypothetical protein